MTKGNKALKIWGLILFSIFGIGFLICLNTYMLIIFANMLQTQTLQALLFELNGLISLLFLPLLILTVASAVLLIIGICTSKKEKTAVS